MGGRVRPRPAQRRSSSRRTGSDHAGLGVRRWSRRGCARRGGRLRHRGGPPDGRAAGRRGRGRARRRRRRRCAVRRGASRRLVRTRHGVRRSHSGPGAGRGAVQRARPRLRAHRTGERVRRGCPMGDRERHAGGQPLAVDLEGRVVRHVPRARRPRLLPPMCRRVGDEQSPLADVSIRVRQRGLRRRSLGNEPRAVRLQRGWPRGVRGTRHRHRGRVVGWRHSRSDGQQLCGAAPVRHGSAASWASTRTPRRFR